MLLSEESIQVSKTFDNIIEKFLEQYAKKNDPIEVSFRELVPELSKSDRATHLIHTYPAKLLMHIPYFFLNNSIFSKPGDIILDPFCGSGTVMLESMLAHRNSIGADANPLARLITRVKTTKYETRIINRLLKNILNTELDDGLVVPKVGNLDYWFLPHIQLGLLKLIEGIKLVEDQKYQDFFWVCFSNCIKKVSLADPRVSVPVKLNPLRYPEDHRLFKETQKKIDNLKSINVQEKFVDIVKSNCLKFEDFMQNNSTTSSEVISDDARKITRKLGCDELLGDETVSLVLSSPPYAGAQKYIRSSSLNLGWLSYLDEKTTLNLLDSQNIGRENYKKHEYSVFLPTGINEADELLKDIHTINPLRAHIASNYLIEMRQAFKESVRVLKKGGFLILIAANNQVCGKEFKTQEYLVEILKSLGLKIKLRLIDDIKSYGLMTKRNKTASVITREWVLVFEK